MRSYGDIWRNIISDEALLMAWRRVRRGHSSSLEVAEFEGRLEEALCELQGELESGRYVPSGYRRFRIFDPKPRTISCAPVRDRIVHHALCSVISPILERSFIHNSFACREGKGAHRACTLARRYCGMGGYWCKMDIRRYFDSVSHDRMLDVLLPIFREKPVRDLIEGIVRHPVPLMQKGFGLPIGNLTSQWFANAFLDEFDHLAQTGFGKGGVRYIRYMDDFVFFAPSKSLVWEMRDRSAQWLAAKRNLDLKEEATIVSPVSEPLPFLGLRILSGSWRLSHARLSRVRRTFADRTRSYEDGILPESRYAMCAASSDGAHRWFGFKGILKDKDLALVKKRAEAGSNRVLRGGNWNNDANNAKSSNRNNNTPSNRNNNYGFRLSSTLPGYCQGPAQSAGAPCMMETNMRMSGRKVAFAKSSPAIFKEIVYEK